MKDDEDKPLPSFLVWLVVAVFCLLLVLSIVYGYVTPQDYKGIPIKFYSEHIDKTACMQALESIEPERLKGVSQISIFYKVSNARRGSYGWNSQNIILYNDCGSLGHEVAHHCQKMKGDTAQEAVKHRGRWRECYGNMQTSMEG